MSLPHKKLREVLLLILYSQEQNPKSVEDLEKLVCEQVKITKKNFYFALTKVDKIKEYLSTIDTLMERICQEFSYNTLQKVEKSILRLGAYEILYDSDVPPKVAIAEAIRLAKKFSSEQACGFVNAILDHLYKESIGKTNHEAK